MGTIKKHEITFEPVQQWPGKPTGFRRSSQFKSTLEKTQQLLDKELAFLNAKNVVLQIYVDRSEIRLDGGLRAGASPKKPGVILSFSCKHGQLMYPCDTYADWKDNLRAIALALEALRSVDRYGVTSRAEQYRGWQQLPAPSESSVVSPDDARTFLGKILGCSASTLATEPIILRSAIRKAQQKTHPDVGGNPEDFKRVMECEKVLLG
jgi:hypothetical protein